MNDESGDLKVIGPSDIGRDTAEATQIMDSAWQELRRSPFVLRQLNLPLERLPTVSLAEVRRRSAVGASILRRLDALDETRLPHALSLSLRAVRFRSHAWSREVDWYGMITDPLGIGFFGLFFPTPYCGGFFLNILNSQIAAISFEDSGDADKYLLLVEDYARLVDELTARTAEQEIRGMRMPRVQVHQARTLLRRLQSGVREVLCTAPRQALNTGRAEFIREIEDRVHAYVEPAFDRALNGLSADYLLAAPESVGMSQYSDGADIYAELVKFHTTLDLNAKEIHVYGHERLVEIERRKESIRAELSFDGDDATFLAHLRQDSRWRAATEDGVAAVFYKYLERIKPHLGSLFAAIPNAPYTVAPLAEALQGSMTYGFFDPPSHNHPDGVYRFNAKNLTQEALFTLGSLTYHELIPGHHLQIGLQSENQALHPFQQYSLLNAYTEGWAEYAATLAGEVGLYEEPEERYGRLTNDAFLTTRLVVDTGMNALGWTLERAREYMRQHGGLAETEVLTESVRYSCDVPGQALAYKIGDRKMLELRERMREALGTRFDLKNFHTAILEFGAIPLPVLEWHVERVIERQLLLGKSNAAQ